MSLNQIAHLVLAPKGGVGKSTIACFISQFLLKLGHRPLVADTDQQNQTLQGFAALQARQYNLCTERFVINPLVFDQLFEDIVAHPDGAVIDTGSSGHTSLMHYMAEVKLDQLLLQSGKQLVLHSVITAGAEFDSGVAGLQQLISDTRAPLVVWLNHKNGRVHDSGCRFEDSDLYQAARGRIIGIMNLPALAPATQLVDFNAMMNAKQTFEEAMASARIVQRKRLSDMSLDWFNQFQQIEFERA